MTSLKRSFSNQEKICYGLLTYIGGVVFFASCFYSYLNSVSLNKIEMLAYPITSIFFTGIIFSILRLIFYVRNRLLYNAIQKFKNNKVSHT